MKTMKDFSTLNSEELSYWLNSINLSRYSNNIIGNNVTGYDLCYLTNDDFKILGISNIHDKNILVKHIRLQTLEQLKLNFRYEGKEATIQLDFDSNFSIFELENFIREIFNIQTMFHLSTESNEMLCPNIKIIELILLNPQKYKKLKIVSGPISSSVQSMERREKEKNKMPIYDDIPRISYDSESKRTESLQQSKYSSHRNYDINQNQYNNESNYRTLYYDNRRMDNFDQIEDENNNSYSNNNIIMNTTPKKYLTDKRISRNSSALMIKPGMALDMNYNRKYNMNYESGINRDNMGNSNNTNNIKNESGLNYDYKSNNDYNTGEWRRGMGLKDDSKINIDTS